MHKRRGVEPDNPDSGILEWQFLSKRLMQERFFFECGGPTTLLLL